MQFTLFTPFLHTFFFALVLLGFHPGSLMHHLADLGLLEFLVKTDLWCLTHHNTHETFLIYPMSMIAILSLDFLLLSCLHVRLRNALLNLEVHELDGYNQEFWKTSGCSLKCESPQLHTRTWQFSCSEYIWSLESVTEAKRSREDGDINELIQSDVPSK